MEHELFSLQELNEFKKTGFNQRHDDLSEPVVIGRYAFELAGKKRSLLPNPDDYIRWYSPLKLNKGETLDLRVTRNEKIRDDKQILKIDGDTNVFVQHLLSQKNFYKEHLEKCFSQSNNQQSANQLSMDQLSISQQSVNPESAGGRGIKKSRPLNVDFVTLRSVLCNLM